METVFASKAETGGRYVTKNGWPITILGMRPSGNVAVVCDLTKTQHTLYPTQLLHPFKEELISMEAITMARAMKVKTAKAPAKAKVKAVTEKKSRDADPRFALGNTVVREYKGKEHRVECTADGLRYEGKLYKSLTSVALAITGYRAISGPAFFALAKEPVAA